jgi:lipoprotein-anchoring transpeptidase ErfK/SrfK
MAHHPFDKIDRMRTRVGLLGVLAALTSSLALGFPARAEDPTTTATTTTTTTTTPTTTGAPEATTVELPADEPTDTLVAAPGGPLVIDGGATANGSLPPRTGKEQVRIEPLPPPPPTIPPEWVLPANSGSGRRAVYSKSRQRVWVVDEAGNVIKTHLVSGRQTPLDPAPGTYAVFSRSRYTHSINNPTIQWGYMVRFAHGAQGGNIGFHEIPTQYGRPVQSVSQLGQPLSGGCVRQSTPDAIWMWNWAYIGTRVVVLP